MVATPRWWDGGNATEPMYDVAPCLTKADQHGVAQPIPFGVSEKPDVGHCLRSGASRADKHESTTYVAQPVAVGTDLYNLSITGDVAVPLTNRSDGTGTGPTVMQPFQQTADCLTAAYGTKWNGNASATNGSLFVAHPMAQPVGTDVYNGNITGDVACTMGTPGSSTNASGPTVMVNMAVRRLTPVECERLQGFPDSYTDIKSKNKPTPDGPRYKALGNSMAVPVMAWIGQRIKQVEQISERND
jgi:DNA (cytosine-5)-methyltransferase 1